MRKTFLALGAAAVAISAIPAGAREYSTVIKCSGYRNGQCVAWNRLTSHSRTDGCANPSNSRHV